MIFYLDMFLRRLRRRISRSENLIQLLGLSRNPQGATLPGLVIIQIDGLSRQQMERAMARKRLPFLRKLLVRQQYKVFSHYSGLPSATPAVQGELFYGIPCAVPAFSFFDRETRRVFRMYDCDDALTIERRLEAEGEPLLKGGASYSNIYSGGADEAHICSTTLGWSGMFSKGSPFALHLFLLFNIYGLLRTVVLLLYEFILAFYDFFRGTIAGQDLWKELKFVPSRVGVSILSRELVTAGVKLDIARGLPVIHLNLLGYDEQSHRRGPTSAFAHWTLRGIDDAVKRIWLAAQASPCRDYDVWIFSDHGQQEVVPYPVETGETIQEAVERVFDHSLPRRGVGPQERRGIQSQRWRLFNWRFLMRPLIQEGEGRVAEEDHRPIIASMGPVGHIYIQRELGSEQKRSLARRLATEARVPLVLIREGESRVAAFTPQGEFMLPEDGARILGPQHPFLREVVHDLIRLVRHPNAGDFVISGWRRGGKPISFPVENGAHAGPGPDEVEGFVMMPADTLVSGADKGYLRPVDLHDTAMRLLGRRQPLERCPPVITRDTLRIMTYNVHSCIGVDGKTSPHRVARVIAQYDPDIVCLQELDIGRLRTDGADQAQIIATYLRMDHHFHPALRLEEELYGDAILSRYPMRLVRADALPGLPDRPQLEPRGALWTVVELNGCAIHVLNTHFGLRRREQLCQARALLGADWLNCAECQGPVILCGDFNALPGSQVCRLLRRRLRDSQLELDRHRPHKTYSTRYPVGRIDHIFVSPHFEVVKVEVARNNLACLASDHLPLIIEVRLKRD